LSNNNFGFEHLTLEKIIFLFYNVVTLTLFSRFPLNIFIHFFLFRPLYCYSLNLMHILPLLLCSKSSSQKPVNIFIHSNMAFIKPCLRNYHFTVSSLGVTLPGFSLKGDEVPLLYHTVKDKLPWNWKRSNRSIRKS